MPLEFTLTIATNPLIYKGLKITLADNSWMWYNVVMESSNKTDYAALAEAWVKAGGEVTKIAAKKMPRHSLRTKSHQKGGRWGAYTVGGNVRIAAMRKSS